MRKSSMPPNTQLTRKQSEESILHRDENGKWSLGKLSRRTSDHLTDFVGSRGSIKHPGDPDGRKTHSYDNPSAEDTPVNNIHSENEAINASCKIVREGISKIGLTHQPVKEFLITIENLRKLPASGKLNISIEFPCSCTSMKSGPLHTTTIVNPQSHNASLSAAPSDRNERPDDETGDQILSRCRAHARKGKQDKQDGRFLQVSRTRPRASSDSNLVRNNSPTRFHLPEIKIEDFSNIQKSPLKRHQTEQAIRFNPARDQTEMGLSTEGEADDDDAFFSESQKGRQRSYTCPERHLKRPNVQPRPSTPQTNGSKPEEPIKKEINRKISSDRWMFQKGLSQVEEDLF